MSTKELFRALQAGEISPETAYVKLAEFLDKRQRSREDSAAESDGPGGKGNELQTRLPAVDWGEIAPGIVQVTMQDRIYKNTFSTELITGLMEAFAAIRSRPDFKVVILTGYDRYFACGGSREGLLALYEGKAKMTDLHLYSLALECEIPVIAAMQGHGLGGGWCLGLFCDFVIMSRESTYACNHMKYGFTPGDGATLILPEKLGNPLAQEILFTGKNFRGSELAARGVGIPILPQREVLPYALELARELAEKPREALILLKKHMAAPLKARLSEVVEREWELQEKTLVGKPEVLEKMLPAFEPLSGPPSFPEIRHLNARFSGRPVFWLHGEGGGLEGYQTIAQKSGRPFYGIQARGHMTEDAPIRGIEAMASYYLSIIRSRQPEGPYDLGGYSLGGVLAYEVARQLQEAGQEVHSIVMLDTLDRSAWEKVRLSNRTRALQAVNMTLLNRTRRDWPSVREKLIHQEEAGFPGDEEEFLRQLIRLGRERGLSLAKTEEELLRLFQQNLRVQEAFQLDQYPLLPLPDPSGVSCYYFRNQSGLFFGELQPYLTTASDQIAIDHECYWSGWEQLFPRFKLLDASSSSHMTMLFEPAAQADIGKVCEALYAGTEAVRTDR